MSLLNTSINKKPLFFLQVVVSETLQSKERVARYSPLPTGTKHGEKAVSVSTKSTKGSICSL
jgi:hypothetical protein